MTQTAGVLTVQAFDTSLASNTYDIELQNTITLASNGAGTTTFNPTASDKVEFTITLRDGCLDATLESPTVNQLDVEDGKTATINFSDASDTYGASLSQLDFCGLRTYEVQDRSTNAVIAWTSIAVDVSDSSIYVITASPESTTDELQTTH